MENRIIYQGPGILSILLVAFVVLKLCGVIAWSWWLVLAPLWVPFILLFIVLLIVNIIIWLDLKESQS